MQHLDSTARASESQIPGTLAPFGSSLVLHVRSLPSYAASCMFACLLSVAHSNRSGSTITVPVLPSGEANGSIPNTCRETGQHGEQHTSHWSLPTINLPRSILGCKGLLDRTTTTAREKKGSGRMCPLPLIQIATPPEIHQLPSQGLLADFKLVRRRRPRPRNWKFSVWPCMGLHRVLRVLHVETFPFYEFDAISTDPAFFTGGHVHLSLLNRLLFVRIWLLDSVVAHLDQETKHM